MIVDFLLHTGYSSLCYLLQCCRQQIHALSLLYLGMQLMMILYSLITLIVYMKLMWWVSLGAILLWEMYDCKYKRNIFVYILFPILYHNNDKTATFSLTTSSIWLVNIVAVQQNLVLCYHFWSFLESIKISIITVELEISATTQHFHFMHFGGTECVHSQGRNCPFGAVICAFYQVSCVENLYYYVYFM